MKAPPLFSCAARLACLIPLAACASGCATYTDRMQVAMMATSAGDYSAAIAELNASLGVSSSAEVPSKWGADSALATLERAILLQSLQQYRDSARSFTAAEQELELLDLSIDPIGTIGSYVYSDSARKYKAPPSERLALNALNLLNFIALGDVEGATVEARRFQVMRDYLESENIEEHGISVLGAYLAGFVFDRRGEGDRSLRYYEEALAAGPLESLRQPAARLARHHPYRGARLRELLSSTSEEIVPRSEVLVVLAVGRVSHKVPERIPIGAAIGIAGAHFTGDADWLARGVAKVVVYPELVSTPSRLGIPVVQIDGGEIALDSLIDIDAVVRHEYEQIKPQILAAALTRLATRAAIAEGVRAAGSQESSLLGAFLGVLVESTLVALDRPDTRSWTMLPGRVLVARVPVNPGRHVVTVDFRGTPGVAREVSVDVPADGFAAVVVTEPR